MALVEKWFTGCGPASLQWKSQQSGSCAVHEAGWLCWSLVFVRIPEKEVLMLVREWTEQ